MRGKIYGDLSFSADRRPRITIELIGDYQNFIEKNLDGLLNQDLEIKIEKYREKRSLSANAYFHLIVNKIAANMRVSDEEVKKSLVLDYGTIAEDENGKLGCMLPETANPDAFYPYCKWYKDKTIEGRRYKCYLFYKQTHTLNTKEMSRLIDGAVTTAKELGIETLPPDKLAAMKTEWSNEK